MFDRWKKLWSMVRMSLRSLMLHKLRSFLTILGLVFGVASVIIMLSIAEGAGRDALRRIESLGINNVIVRSIKPTGDEVQTQSGVLEYGLTFTDMKRIGETLDTVASIAPFREFNYEARHVAQMQVHQPIRSGTFANRLCTRSRSRPAAFPRRQSGR